MFQELTDVKIESSYKSNSKSYGRVENRKYHGFIFRLSGECEYDFHDKAVVIKGGEVLFVPSGANYEYRVLSDFPSQYMSINFSAENCPSTPTVYSLESFADFEYMKNHFTDMFRVGALAERYKCLSMLYSMLSHISSIEHADYSDKDKVNIIKPAVDYMKTHMFDSDLCIDSLHRLCGISDTYFRRIFIARYGITPRKYITSKRISQAKAIIDSGEFETVGDVALSVGYTDALYFSRVFKEHYGVSPSSVK